MNSKKEKQKDTKKCSYPVIKRNSPSPILQVSEANSTSIDTTAHTIKPLEIFNYLTIKRKCYAFQLLKQFILFSDDDDSELLYSLESENSPFKPKINIQHAEDQISSMCSVIKRAKQKLLLNAYDKLKKRYFKRKMAYRNKEYVQKIVQKISNLVKDQHKQVMQYVFLGLVQNMKQTKLKEIIQKNRADGINVPEQIQYEDKLFKTKEYLPFHTDEQSGIMKNDTESFFESDSRIRIAKDFDIRKSKLQNSETPFKTPEYQKQNLTTRHKSKSTSKEISKQLIYIVGTGKKYSFSKQKRPEPNRHIKIPIQSSNVDIVRVQGFEEIKKRKSKQKRDEYFKKVNQKYVQDCSKCEYCVKIKLSEELMSKIRVSKRS